MLHSSWNNPVGDDTNAIHMKVFFVATHVTVGFGTVTGTTV